jgi:hypothetical protein
LFTITGGAVGGACGVRPLVVRSWPGEHNGIRTPKHAAQRTDEPQWVAGAVCRMHAGKMARVIFMRRDMFELQLILQNVDFIALSIPALAVGGLWCFRVAGRFDFSFGACSVPALTCMKAM